MDAIQKLIEMALEEDIGPGDITTDSLIGPEAQGRGVIRSKAPAVVAGLDVARRVFRRLDPLMAFGSGFRDGDTVSAGDTLLTLEGNLQALLKGERTALNFLQRLSGIATHVRSFVNQLGGDQVRLVDTRKTVPGWRLLEKYAVRVGGAGNHRMGLFDGVLIKDNHIAACGGITAAVERIRPRVSHLTKIEVEVTSLAEVEEALAAGADVIMLDNMDLDTIRQAVGIIRRRALVEVSGGVSKGRLDEIAATGVDLISVGALTHGAVAVDISMDIEQG